MNGPAALQDANDHTVAWRRYRRWSLTFWVLFLLFLPTLDAINRGFPSMRANPTAIFIVALAWLIAFAMAGYQKSNFRCPRCGELFFRKFDDRPWRKVWWHNPFARRCMHCQL